MKKTSLEEDIAGLIDGVTNDLKSCMKQNDQLREQLAAEREKREYWEQAYKQLFDATAGKL